MSFEPLSMCTSATVWRVGRIKKKGQGSQRVTKEPPARQTNLPQNCVWGAVFNVVMCAKFQNEILRGCDSTGGQNFDFCIDFE